MKAYQYNLLDELIVDNFAGGGGASTGIELATGRIVNIAVNHDKSAIEMHSKNHPYTQHFCEDVWQVNPKKVTNGQPVALAWFSPDYVLEVSDSYTKSAQIARIGNSVCPVMAKVLVQANLPELCGKKNLETMAQLEKTFTAWR